MRGATGVGRRAVVLVLDGVGAGAAVDADRFGDAGADTLGHVAAAVGGLRVPALERLGLGAIAPLAGVAVPDRPTALVGGWPSARRPRTPPPATGS